MSSVRILLCALAGLSFASSGFGVPSVAGIDPPPGAEVSGLTGVSVTFSEPVTGVQAQDLGLNGEPLTTVTGSGAGPYVFSFAQPPAGLVTLAWDIDQSIAGIGGGEFVTPAGWDYTLTDTIAPTLGKIRTTVSGQEMEDVFPTPGSIVAVVRAARVTFSEAVTGVTAPGLLVNGVPATAVTGDAAGPYDFSFTEPAPGASVNFTWAGGHGIADGAGNAFDGKGWSVTQGLPGTVRITEFLVNNGGTAVMPGSDPDGTRDENWDLSSWIELHNAGAFPVNLLGWSLTDDPANPRQWVLPSRTLAAGARLIVFASGKDRKPASGNLHTNFGLSANGGSLALFSPDVPPATTSVSASSFENYPPQRYDYSYGAQGTDGQPRYFSPPTVSQGAYTLPSSDLGAPPGTLPPQAAGLENGSSALTNLTPEPAASVGRGFFNEPFAVVLSCSDITATVRYTLDGSPPLASSAAYTSPLNVSATTILRAAAFGTGKVPSRAVTHTYLFPDQVVNQPSPPYDNPARNTDDTNPRPPAPGGLPLPIAWGTNSTFTAAQTLPGFPTGTAAGSNNLAAGQIPADYGMDPKVYADPTKYNDAGAVDPLNGKTNLDRIKSALRTLPALSLVMKSADMFGAYPNGTTPAGTVDPLYPNSSASIKRDMTKPCSLELIQPGGGTVFVTDAGIDLHGNASRDPFKNPKHGFTIRFKGKYGAGKVDGRIFPDSPVREWDKLVLRGDFGGSWMHQSGADALTAGSDASQRARGIRIREAFCKDSFRAMGRVASHHRFCNLFINGVCWGSYELMEDQAEDFSASYLGGNKDDHDVVDQGKLKSGTWAVWSSIKTLLGWTGGTAATDNVTPPSNYLTTFTNAQYETLRTRLDMPWFEDYMIWQTFAGHRDWATDASDAGKYMKNVYFIRPKNGTFKAMPWDMENLLWHEAEDRVTAMTTFTTAPTLFPPAVIHPRVKTNAEYRLEFADRAWRHMVRPGGALTPAENIARLDKWTAVIGPDAIALESARWGDYRYKVHAYTSGTVNQVYSWNGAWYDSTGTAQYNGVWTGGGLKFNTGRAQASQLGTYNTGMANAWYDEIRRLRTVYFPARTANVLNQYRANGLYPFLNAPELRNNANNADLADTVVPFGTLVKLVMPSATSGNSSAGDIYLTVDGTDPRPPYDQSGTPRAGAALYTAPFAVTASTVIKARARTTMSDFPQKSPVRAASTASVTMTYTATGGAGLRGQISAAPLVLDGQTLSAGDRLLLKNQAIAAQNGIWVVTNPGAGATGVWDRAPDWDADGEVTGGTWVRVTAGTQNANSNWRVTNTAAITVGGASGTAVAFASQPFSPWSALMEITLTVGPPLATVCISEINYNPKGSQGGAAAEFVEFYNYGNLPVEMTSWSMEGIDFVFPAGFTLAPGQRVIIASRENPVTFSAQYPGVVVLGYFGGTLDNGGERLSLLDSTGSVVHSVEFDDDYPWPGSADNGGYSLEIISAAGDPQSGANWRASTALKGSPGTAGAAPPSPAILISEFLARDGDSFSVAGAPADYIELHNPGASAVPLSGWTIRTGSAYNDTDAAFGFSPAQSIPAGGYLLLPAMSSPGPGPLLSTMLSRDHGNIQLADPSGQVVDGIRYGPQAAGLSFSRINGAWTLSALTPGSVNAPAAVSSRETLVINEVMANPAPGGADWLELYADDADHPCVLTGLTFEVNGALFRVSVPAVIGGGGYCRLWCRPGGQDGDNLNLALPAAGSTVRIYSESWNPLASQSIAAQNEDVTSGLVDGPGWTELPYPSPGSRNLLLPSNRLRLNEVMVRNLSGANTPWATRDPWVELHNPLAGAVDLSGYGLRSVMAWRPAVTYPFPPGTVIPAGGYLALWSGTLGMAFDTLEYDHHGLELILPDGQISDRVTWGRQLPDKSIGRLADGTWALLATPTRGTANSAAHPLGPVSSVKINEWQAETASQFTNRGEFVELYNSGVLPAHLGGLWLSDDPSEAGLRKQIIPALSFIPGSGYFVMVPEGGISGDFPGGAPLWPFSYNFRIAAGGEVLRLSQNDAAATAIDSVNFGAPPVLPLSSGRLSDGSDHFTTLTGSPGWPNAAGPLPYFSIQQDDIVISMGSSLRLFCRTELAANCRWQRDGADITAPFTVAEVNGLAEYTATADPDSDGLYTCVASNASGSTASRAIRVTVLANYSRWSAAYGVGGMHEDADHDGISNGDEFLSGTDPLAATPLTLGITGGREADALILEYTLSSRASFTSLTGQRSGDLSLWNDAADAAFEILATQPNGDQRVKVRFPWLPGDEREFVRLHLVP